MMANDKRLIDANAFRVFWNKNYRHQYANDIFLVAIANFPTVDAVEVVRCVECTVPHNRFTGCPKLNGLVTPPDFYCPYGERKINGES